MNKSQLQQHDREHLLHPFTDFKAYAESFGIPGYRPRSGPELRSQLAAALQSDGLNVIEVAVDPSVNNELVQRLRQFETGGAGGRE